LPTERSPAPLGKSYLILLAKSYLILLAKSYFILLETKEVEMIDNL